MQQEYVDGLKDFITGASFSMESDGNLEPLKYRVKMKAGVTILDLTSDLLPLVWGIDRGLGNHVERSVTQSNNVGEYATIFFYPESRSFRYQQVMNYTSLSTFFSQFEIVYDTLPEYVEYPIGASTTIVIDSEDFTAPNGLFDSISNTNISFAGSTFKVGPKIWSDKIFSEMRFFPPTENLIPVPTFKPFAGCPNLESIAYQGTFGSVLEFLGETDLTYYDEDGFGHLDAYPECGEESFPKSVRKYVKASKIHLSAKFPRINSRDLKISSLPFDIEEIVIDTDGIPRLPFGGIDYTDAEMELLHLCEPKFTVNLPLQDPEELNFSWGWGNLGIAAPSVCYNVKNLHKIWRITSRVQKTTSIASPEYLKTQVSFLWGNALEDALANITLAPDYMPLVPSGVRRCEGHYALVELGEEESFWNDPPVMESYELSMTQFYTVQPLPATCEIVYQYAMNLYSHLVVNTDLSIPPLPANTKISRDCYRRTFYNTYGERFYSIGSLGTPVVMLAYSKSESTPIFTPLNIVANLDNSYAGEFKDWMNNNTGIEVTRYLGSSGGLPTVDGPESWSNFNDLIAAVTLPVLTQLDDTMIKNDITLGSTGPSAMNYNGDFQRECFFGSMIDPREQATLISVPQTNEWRNYQAAMNFAVPQVYRIPAYLWKGTIEIDEGNFIDDLWVPDYHDVRFTIWVGNLVSNDPADNLITHIDDVIWTGPPRTESSTSVDPYHTVISSSRILGDYNAFMASKNIVLDNPGDFAQGAGESVRTHKMFVGNRFGLNGNFYDLGPSYFPEGKRCGFAITGSYVEGSPNDRFTQGETLVPNQPPAYYTYHYEDPLWVDSYRVALQAPNTHYLLSSGSQSELDNVELSINNIV